MGISVIPAMPRPASNAPQAANAGSSADEASGLDFSALLATQIDPAGMSGEMSPLASMLAAGLVHLGEKNEKSLPRADEEALDPSETGTAIALLDLLPQRPARPEAALSNQTDQGAIAEFNGVDRRRISLAIGGPSNATDKSASLGTASGNIAFELPKQLAAEPAKLAGEATPLPTASPLALATERPTTDTRAQPTQTSISTPLNDHRWAQDFGDRIVWATKSGVQSAQINLNPAQLGPVQINISLNGDQMTANFISAHPEVRQAMEDAMPRLRDMLASAGINLGQANVGAQTQQQQREAPPQFASAPRWTSEDAILPAENTAISASSGSILQRGRGMVDLFA